MPAHTSLMTLPTLSRMFSTPAVTPPGFKTANGVTVPCESGSYRSGWAPAGLAQTCISCGVGVFADKTDRVTQYNLVTNVVELVAVTSDSNDCCKFLLGNHLVTPALLFVGHGTLHAICFSCMGQPYCWHIPYTARAETTL